MEPPLEEPHRSFKSRPSFLGWSIVRIFCRVLDVHAPFWYPCTNPDVVLWLPLRNFLQNAFWIVYLSWNNEVCLPFGMSQVASSWHLIGELDPQFQENPHGRLGGPSLFIYFLPTRVIVFNSLLNSWLHEDPALCCQKCLTITAVCTEDHRYGSGVPVISYKHRGIQWDPYHWSLRYSSWLLNQLMTNIGSFGLMSAARVSSLE